MEWLGVNFDSIILLQICLARPTCVLVRRRATILGLATVQWYIFFEVEGKHLHVLLHQVMDVLWT